MQTDLLLLRSLRVMVRDFDFRLEFSTNALNFVLKMESMDGSPLPDGIYPHIARNYIREKMHKISQQITSRKMGSTNLNKPALNMTIVPIEAFSAEDYRRLICEFFPCLI